MAIKQTTDPEQLEKDRQTFEKHSQLQSDGQMLQQEQLRDLLQNPQVFELLTEPDVTEKPEKSWLNSLAEEHLHIDQVLSIYDRDDLWRKGWANKIWAEQIIMSYPHPESRSADKRVQKVQERIHGHDKAPLTTDQERQIRSIFEQKTDREKRGEDGEFVDLLLSQVVKSEERSSGQNENSSGWWPLGGD